MYRQTLDRQVKYEAARAYSESVGKPLLVVGGPWGSNPFRRLFTQPAHGWGDVCLDVDPSACRGCPGNCKTEVADVRSIPYPNHYFASVYCSHVLEHMLTVKDFSTAYQELQRVADAVFVCVPSKQSILAWLISDHHLWVTETSEGLVAEQRQ